MIEGSPIACVALVTPFDEQGEIDEAAFARLIAWHEANGMDGIVVAGTNGEGPSLTGPEKRDLCALACSVRGSLKVIAGLGTCSIKEATWLARRAYEAGCDALLALPPFYFRNASARGIRAFFDALLRESPLPVIAYNHPMTGVDLSPEILADLASEHENLMGVKDSSGDYDRFLEYRRRLPGKLALVGDETLLLKSLQDRGNGTISGLANSLPHLVARQVREQNPALQRLIDEACAGLKAHPAPGVHKFVLSELGLSGGCLRPPLEPLNETQQSAVRDFLSSFEARPSLSA
ncbi:MAG: 4-hydroxy-tetrahydrodipicolinate synthase [Fimbriimonadales bacterium]|nr:MAG: 4-hydroxy-tetrahydrodipicolinate synthase [Fimbriimonadales bacterium]